MSALADSNAAAITRDASRRIMAAADTLEVAGYPWVAAALTSYHGGLTAKLAPYASAGALVRLANDVENLADAMKP